MMSRFDYVQFDSEHTKKLLGIKTQVMTLEKTINELGPSRATSLAHTKLEEVYMWLGKALRDSQVTLLGSNPSDERGNT